MSYHGRQQGFIALVSAIIISILLLTITVSLGFSGFFTRFNIVDSESKERSLALAEGCIDTAILNLAQNPSYNPIDQIVTIGGDRCTIMALQKNVPAPGQTSMQTQACINTSTTNLNIIIDSAFSITSLEEIPNFSPNHSCL